MLKTCVRCKLNPAKTSVVVNGVYVKDICDTCKAVLAPIEASSGHARWARGVDLEDHEHEIQQPYNGDGSINVKFAKLYPRQASAIFTPEQLRRASM